MVPLVTVVTWIPSRFLENSLNETFSQRIKSDLNRHKKIHECKQYICEKCNKTFVYKFNFKKHAKTCSKYVIYV